MLAAVPSWIDWTRTAVFLGDERPVPPDHPDSNWGMIERELLSRLPVRPTAHRLVAEADDLDAAAADYARLMADVLGASAGGVPMFDVVLLGLGSDGHTASLFPGTAALEVRDRWYVANSVPSRGATRLTMTFPVIEAARDVLVLASGASKARVLASVLSERDDAFPATRLAALPHVRWLVDEAAARAL
jgi:6-phosphogluconolactonase